MKYYLDETFNVYLKSTKLRDYSSYTSVKNAYQEFVTKSLSVIDIVAPIRTFKLKPNTNLGLILTS